MSLYNWTGPMPCPSSDPNGPWNEPEVFEPFICEGENCDAVVKYEGSICSACRASMEYHAND